MAHTLRELVHDLPCEEQEPIGKQTFERRAALADLKAFGRVVGRKMGTPDREADRLD